MSDDIAVTPSSGNVFADLDLEQPEEELVNAELTLRIRQIIERRKLTAGKAAQILGVSEPLLTKLVRGDLRGLSTDRLLRCHGIGSGRTDHHQAEAALPETRPDFGRDHVMPGCDGSDPPRRLRQGRTT